MNQKEVIEKVLKTKVVHLHLRCKCGNSGMVGEVDKNDEKRPGFKVYINGEYADIDCMRCGQYVGYINRKELA